MLVYAKELETLDLVYSFFRGLHKLREGNMLDANGDLQRLRHLLRTCASGNPPTQRAIDSLFHDFDFIGQNYSATYDAIIERLSEDLLKAPTPEFCGGSKVPSEQEILEKAYKDFVVLTDIVVVEIRRRHPNLQEYINTSRNNFCLLGEEKWEKFFASNIPEGHEAIFILARRLLLAADEKRYKGKLAIADIKLRGFLK